MEILINRQPASVVRPNQAATAPELEETGTTDHETPNLDQVQLTVSAATPSPEDLAKAEQAERISAYVQDKKIEGAKHLRSAMGLMAGQLTGMAIGSMIFAPLAFKFGNLYIATGGAALTGGAMALLGSKLASRPVQGPKDNGLAEGALTAGAALRSLPNIAYPTLVGHTEAQKAVVYGALDKLPLSGVTSTPTIDFVTGMDQAGAAGLATPLFSQSRVFLDRTNMAYSDAFMEEVTIHEIGHTYDFTKGAGPIGNISHRGGGFGKAPFISDYAHTNRMEDFAESYTSYHLEPERLAEVAPDKYAALERVQQPGVVEHSLDRPSVRDAGKRIGTAFERAPRLRNLLALGSSLLSPFQLYRGAANYEHGVQSGDKETLFNSKMQLAMGSTLFFPGTAPLSLAVAIDRMAVNQQLKDGSMTADEANAHADKVLTLATGPFGFVASSLQDELKRGGLLTEAQHLGVDDFQLSSSDSKAGRSAAWMAGGFALGAAAGGVLTPLLHASSAVGIVGQAANGTWLGGLAGAALGLGMGHLTRTQSSGFGLDQQASALTKEDKSLLTKLTVPTVLGGAAGAVAGGYAGSQAGRLLGQSVAGAVGGVTGATVGQYLGMLGGSYAAAKGGAKVGAAWAGLGKQPSPSRRQTEETRAERLAS